MLWLLRLLLLLEDALLEKLFWRYILLYQFSTALQVKVYDNHIIIIIIVVLLLIKLFVKFEI
jgi:hypothetical protein